MSMLFTTAVVWLIMRWSEQARLEEKLLKGGQHPFGLQANRYLILIAYLFGLATGVHLLNLLALFFIAFIFFFTEFDRKEWTTPGQADWLSFKRWQGIALTGVVSLIPFGLVYPVIIKWLPKWAGESGWPMTFLLGVFALVAFGIFYSQKRRLQVVNLITRGRRDRRVHLRRGRLVLVQRRRGRGLRHVDVVHDGGGVADHAVE